MLFIGKYYYDAHREIEGIFPPAVFSIFETTYSRSTPNNERVCHSQHRGGKWEVTINCKVGKAYQHTCLYPNEGKTIFSNHLQINVRISKDMCHCSPFR